MDLTISLISLFIEGEFFTVRDQAHRNEWASVYARDFLCNSLYVSLELWFPRFVINTFNMTLHNHNAYPFYANFL